MQRTVLFLFFLASIMSGCRREADFLPAERVYTVDEFLSAPELRRKVSAACSNDPGRTSLEPNCINVNRADRIAASGSLGGMPRVVP